MQGELEENTEKLAELLVCVWITPAKLYLHDVTDAVECMYLMALTLSSHIHVTPPCRSGIRESASLSCPRRTWR